MVSSLGPALAYIFVGFYETKLFQAMSKPEMYYKYMDDTFVVFGNENQCEVFLKRLHSPHASSLSLVDYEKKSLTLLFTFSMC